MRRIIRQRFLRGFDVHGKSKSPLLAKPARNGAPGKIVIEYSNVDDHERVVGMIRGK